MRPFYSKKKSSALRGEGGGMMVKRSCRVSGSWVKRPGNYLLAPLSINILAWGQWASNDSAGTCSMFF